MPQEGIPKKREDIQLEINLEDGFKKELKEFAQKNQIHENLLNKVKGEWLACGMPIEEFLSERENKILGIKYSGYDINAKYLSKISGVWRILYESRQLTIDEWKKEVDKEKLRQRQAEEEREDDRRDNSGGWR